LSFWKVNIANIMSTLERLGASPRKSFGQNFLVDGNMAKWIVAQVAIEPGDHIVEIGPGLGALTANFAQLGVSATLLEKDKLLAQFIESSFPADRIRVIRGDALDCDVREFFPLGAVKVVGNLPYYLSTPILFHFTADPCPFERLVFTIQREVAARLVAEPSTKEYGAISVLLQAKWKIERLRTLAPSLFFPRPQVESAVIRLTRRLPQEAPEIDWSQFNRLVKAGFAERRKQLRKNLGKLYPMIAIDEALAAIELSGACRAEELPGEKWLGLAKRILPSAIEASDTAEGLAVVDENDRPVGAADRRTVHEKDLRHRAVHVFITNPAGELFLQKRSWRKDRYPYCWDSSAAGHVSAGETYDDCGRRELAEELGVSVRLERIGTVAASEKTGQEFVWIYRGSYDGPIDANPSEIEMGGFFRLATIDTWIDKRPQDFAPGFLECYRAVRSQF
jgi:16S rRNA (adenine1518-N6/adenine1519-N6)-dimethyltransferase